MENPSIAIALSVSEWNTILDSLNKTKKDIIASSIHTPCPVLAAESAVNRHDAIIDNIKKSLR